MSRILFQDIDGCLNIVQNKKPRTIDVKGKNFIAKELAAWKRIQEACTRSQTQLIIVTGRTIHQMVPIIKELNASWVIAEHGGVLYNPQNKKRRTILEVHKEQKQGSKEYKTLEQTCREIQNVRKYIKAHETQIKKQVRALKEYSGEPLYLPKSALNCSILYPEAIRIAGKQSAFAQIIFSCIPKLPPSIRVSIGLYGLDFLTKITKKDGIQALASLLNLNLEKSMYIGDEVGDIAPMSIVRMPCCPANAMAEVKNYVLTQKGMIAQESYVQGTLEILRKAQRK